MKYISDEQKQEILDIVEEGKHVNSRGKVRPSENALFDAFVLYAKMRGILGKSFKLKSFRKESRSKRYEYPYKDCPLKKGQLMTAVRYGKRNGLIENISHSSSNHNYKFTKKVIDGCLMMGNLVVKR